MIPIVRIRNFGIIAHIDSGKTTVSERILFLARRIHQMGDVHDGNTALDFDPIEREKGITIQAAVTAVTWKEHHLNLIDTPGHVDFTAEVERSCRVLDGAVAVFCAVAGVQAQSETVWRQAARYGVPCLILINKADREGVDIERVLGELRQRLDAHPVVLTYPLGTGADLRGVVDVIHRRVHRFGGDDLRAWTQEPLPEAERQRCEAYRRQLIEAVAAESEELIEQWSRLGDLAPAEIIAGLRAAVARRTLHPVLCGAALATIGIQPLLDAIVDLLPSPAEARAITAHAVDDDGVRLAVVPDAALPLRALVFKVVCTPHGEIGFCRVYQGTLRTGDHLWCPNRQVPERAARVVKLHGAEQTAIQAAGPGDLCAISGIRHAVTGDTLCPAGDQAVLDGITFAQPVLGMAVEPVSAADRQALGEALARLAREDPGFSRHVDPETGQLVISGMGELHLEILARRLEDGHRVRVRLGPPQVSRRQRITRAVVARGLHRIQNGGPGAFGDVLLALRPQTAEELAEGEDLLFAVAIRGGAVDRAYHGAIEDGVRGELARGGAAGVRIVGVHATLVDGSMHDQDSNERAFAAAGALAVREALGSLGLEVLEPWMRVQVDCPTEHVGVVIGSLNIAQGRVTEVVPQGTRSSIRASAPLARLFGYSVTLRSLTQGRGACAVEPDGFRPVAKARTGQQ